MQALEYPFDSDYIIKKKKKINRLKNKNRTKKIIELKRAGYTHGDIAEELGISIKTIQREMKDLPEEYKKEFKGGDVITKLEKKYIDRIRGERELFEDTEEGWVYHMTE